MTPYEETNQILQTEYTWPLDCSLAPKATQTDLDDGKAPADIARTADNWCKSVAATYHYGDIEPGTQDAYVQVRYLNFATRCKYWEYNTGLALGQFVEIPAVQFAPARTTTEWTQNLALGIDYLGYPNFDPNSDEAARRKAIADNVPMEVADAGLAGLWKFYAMYEYPFHLDEHRGLDTQKALDNLWARQEGHVIPWMPEQKQV